MIEGFVEMSQLEESWHGRGSIGKVKCYKKDIPRMLLSDTPSNPVLVVCLKDTAKPVKMTASTATMRSKTKVSQR